MKHKGSFEDLQTIVKAVGFHIADAGPKGNCQQIRTEEGAIVNLFSSTGTVQFQGDKAQRDRLEASIAEYLGRATVIQHVAEPAPAPRSFEPKQPVSWKKGSKKVFVVHGHDSVARDQLELILHRLGLDPFVLQNTGGSGLTIIEALEKEIVSPTDGARFGIVLLTPDDVGYAKSAGEKEAQPRARQNVVLEMGMLIAAVGRSNVAILKKGHLEVPSDAQGILYIPFNDHLKETAPKLVDRLRAAGFVLNPEAITKATA